MEESEDLLEMDYKMATGRNFEEASFVSPLEALCRATSVKPDARNSELLVSLHPDLRLASIRAHLLRGNFSEAEAIVNELSQSDDQKMGQSSGEILTTELALEKSRMAAFQGEWELCLSLCNRGLALQPPVITHLSLLQVRSVAFYEMGAFKQSLNDVEMILSRKTLFPVAVAVKFSQVLRLKNLVALRETERVTGEINLLWRDLVETEPLNLDQLLVLLRAEIDLKRSRGETHGRLALGALHVAQVLGDRLYESLALIDCFFALSQLGASLEQRLLTGEQEFVRVQNLKMQAQSAEPWTTTARSLKTAVKEDLKTLASQDKEIVLMVERGFLFNVKSGKAFDLKNESKWLEAVLRLDQGVAKKDFFFQVWKQRYSSDLHDGVLRTFLYRLRKKYDVKVSSQNGVLIFENVIVV